MGRLLLPPLLLSLLLFGTRSFAEDAADPEPEEVSAAESAEPEAGEGAESEEEAAPSAGEGEAAPPPEDAAPAEPDPESEAIDRARRHFLQGLRLVDREAWAPALAEFDASLEAYPTQAALYNRALSLRELHRYAEAMVAFEQFLAGETEESDPRRAAEADRLLSEVRELLTPVVVRANVPGATVLVDGREVGTTPLQAPLQLLSGRRVIVVEAEGFEPGREVLQVVAGREMSVDLELAVPAPQGRVHVLSNVEGAEVYVGGELVGAVPWRGALAAGDHEVEVTAHGYRTELQRITVEADDDVSTTITLSRLVRAHRAWFWSAIGLTAAGFLTTTGLGTAVAVLDSEYDFEGPDAVDDYARGTDLEVATDVTLGITLAAAAGALVLAFFTDWAGPPAAPAAEAVQLRLAEGGAPSGALLAF